MRGAGGGGGWVSASSALIGKDSLGETRGMIQGEGIVGVEVGVGGWATWIGEIDP